MVVSADCTYREEFIATARQDNVFATHLAQNHLAILQPAERKSGFQIGFGRIFHVLRTLLSPRLPPKPRFILGGPALPFRRTLLWFATCRSPPARTRSEFPSRHPGFSGAGGSPSGQP